MTSTVGKLQEFDVFGQHGEGALSSKGSVDDKHYSGSVTVHALILGNNSRGICRSLMTDMAAEYPRICFDHVVDMKALASYCEQLSDKDRVLLGFVTSEIDDIDEVLLHAARFKKLAQVEWLVITDRQEHHDLSVATGTGQLASVVGVPWTVPLLLGQSYSVMQRNLHRRGLADNEVLHILGTPPSTAVFGPLLEGLDYEDSLLVRHLLEGAERILGPRPRLVIPAGVDLTKQGHHVNAVHLVLEGHVALRRDTDHGELMSHHSSSGPLIGLVALARSEGAFFTSTTTTDSQVVRLTNEQLQLVLAHEPEMSATLAILAIQSLTRRLMRAEELHEEKNTLAADLEVERQRLFETLVELRRTRVELVERARYAMLGELSAGIAHELNNPVTALARGAEHLGEDIEKILRLSEAEEGQSSLSVTTARTAREAMENALHARPRSTSQERQLAASFLDVTGGNRAMARRLVNAGVDDIAVARQLVDGDASAFEAVEIGAKIGVSLRSVLAASERVIGLTTSLKGYSRPDSEELKETDICSGLDDVLRLVQHRLRDIVVECDYADVPPVLAQPAKLQQVWTNLLVNAAEALEDETHDAEVKGTAPPARGQVPPTIKVAVHGDNGEVVVTISDNGPGIPDELVEKIFEPHFTTKAGRVRYGLGMGMSIVKSIITEAQGRLDIDSEPGSTRIRVTLPTADSTSYSQHNRR